jgi:hypothetical protein
MVGKRMPSASSLIQNRFVVTSGCAYLKPLQTLTAGIPFGRPYSAAFSVR